MAEKSLLLQILDQQWKEHLLHLDHLRQGIGLRAYGQRDPLNEYKREAFELFEAMLTRPARNRDRACCPMSRSAWARRPKSSRQPRPHPRRLRPGCGNPARARLWHWPAPTPSLRRRRKTSARSPATHLAPAARARSTSTATGGCSGASTSSTTPSTTRWARSRHRGLCGGSQAEERRMLIIKRLGADRSTFLDRWEAYALLRDDAEFGRIEICAPGSRPGVVTVQGDRYECRIHPTGKPRLTFVPERWVMYAGETELHEARREDSLNLPGR